MLESERDMKTRLPTAAFDLAKRLGVTPGVSTPLVTLTQQGRMKWSLDLESWISFSARQTISTLTCEFDWRAKAGPIGILSIRDAINDSEPCLAVHALGFIPLVRAPMSDALMRGELMRYLAEIALAPDAILLNKTLRWRADGPERLIVGAGSDTTASEVVLNLDSDGRIMSAFAPNRPRSVAPPILETPWTGRYSDYRLHNNRWLPFEAEVAWEIDGLKRLYWQGTMKSWAASP